MAVLYPLSQKTINLLRIGPQPGGTHDWLPRVAGGLNRALSKEKAFSFLRKCCDEFVHHRVVLDGEISSAVELAFGDGKGELNIGRVSLSWPEADQSVIQKVIAETTPVFDAVSDPGVDTAKVLPFLFHPGELVCTGFNQSIAVIQPLEEILNTAVGQQFIVINPMKDFYGKNKQGKKSIRCQDNTGQRRFLVAEFDDESLTKKNQASIATKLGETVPLVMAVDSGGKSIHAWYRVDQYGTKDQARFFALACLLGADETRWDSCGWLRMPGGLREKDGQRTTRQRILYFNERNANG